MATATLAMPSAIHYDEVAQTDAANAARRAEGERVRKLILTELARREREHEPAPSWPELGAAVKASAHLARYHAVRLRVAGLVTFRDGETRTIVLTPAGRAQVAG